MTTTTSVPYRLVRCPTCGGDSVYGSINSFRPFCSERCKTQDFGAWASESYKVEESLDVEQQFNELNSK